MLFTIGPETLVRLRSGRETGVVMFAAEPDPFRSWWVQWPSGADEHDERDLVPVAPSEPIR